METSDSNYSHNTTQPLLVSTVLSTNVLHAKDPQNQGTKVAKDKLRRCKKCRKTFKNHGTFLSHVKFHNTKSRRPSNKDQINNILFQQQEFQCKTCDATCAGVSAFLEHMKSHTEDHDASYSSLQQQEVIVGNSTIQIPTIETGDVTPQVIGEPLRLGTAVGTDGDQLTTDDLQHIPTTIYNNQSPQNSGINIQQLQPNLPQPVSFQGSSNNNNGLHIEIPTHIKSLSFNSNTNTGSVSQLNDIIKTLESLHNKIDVVIKHLNIPLDDDGNPIPPATNTIEVNQPQHSAQNATDSSEQGGKTMDDTDGETVLLEGFPPSYSIVQAAKEQQQQEFYALTLSNRQTQHLTQASNEVKLLKGKGIDLWVPTSHQYILAEAQPEDESTELTIPIPTTTPTPTITLPSSIVDKIFVESRSRANFAKNLTFAIFTQEERRGRNCTGRVFGKAQTKGQLDPVKLGAVKEATFRKYPCSPNLMDITWRKECITAIDSGLRNEHRSTSLKGNVVTSVSGETSPSMPTHHHQLVNQTVTNDLKVEVESDRLIGNTLKS